MKTKKHDQKFGTNNFYNYIESIIILWFAYFLLLAKSSVNLFKKIGTVSTLFAIVPATETVG